MSLEKTTTMSKSLKADEAIARYLAVGPGSDEDHGALPAADGDYAFGISQEIAEAAEAEVEVMMEGIAKCTAAAAIAVGDPVCVNDAVGKLRKALPLAVGTSLIHIVGHATTAATTDGDYFHVHLAPSKAVES